MRLGDLSPNPGSNRRRKRIGRGIGSGHGKTSTHGHKGQFARNSVRPGFEGGQTPLHRRLPRYRGFKNMFAVEYAIVNLSQLDRFEAGTTVTPELLAEQRIIQDVKYDRDESGITKVHTRVKILGNGELSKALTIRAHKFSKSAQEKIAAQGGAAEVIE
jgi:large subunit ribosomal protein L15